MDYGVSPTLSNWGGYIADIVNVPPGTTSWSAYVEFVLPASVSYVQAPNSGTNKMLAWAGLGGCDSPFPQPCTGTNALWQAGILLTLTSGNALAIHPFTDECVSSSSCKPAIVYTGQNVALGDSVYMRASYSTSGGATYYIQDFGPGHQWTIQGTCQGLLYCYDNFAPMTTTAEWIIEPAYAVSGNSDCGVSQGAPCVFPNFGTFTVPNNEFGTTPLSGDWSLALLRGVAADGHQPAANYAVPSTLTSGPILNSGGWSVSWGTSPGQ